MAGTNADPRDDPGVQAVEPQGLSAFLARVLNQLSLAAWLPGAVLAAGVLMLYQFRTNVSLSLSEVMKDFGELSWTALVLAIPMLVLATLLTQAFSFESIRTLEGYWRRRGPASWLRTAMTRWQLHRKASLERRRRTAAARAFQTARPILLDRGEDPVVVLALEAYAVGSTPLDLDDKQQARVDLIGWRSACQPWDLALVDRLMGALDDYPVNSRVLPTRLGNVLRATEDRLVNTDGDLEGFVLRRRLRSPARVVEQHDQFRTRLDMYCTLVFVAGFLALLTFYMLHAFSWQEQLVVAAAFGALAWSSYGAAIASARGYCATLRAMDRTDSSGQ
jgi:hypothetical protein